MRDYKLYMHINKINGKKYIGITQQKIQRRWRNNGRGYIKSVFFYKAIQKYGWDNFEHIVLEDGLTLEEANQKEIDLINKYNTTNEKYGYNLDLGGTNGKHSKEVCERLKQIAIENHKKGLYDNSYKYRKGHKPAPKSKEGIEKLRQNMLKNNPMKNPETRLKVSRANKGKFIGEKSVCSKKVKCLETGEIFNSLNLAMNKYNNTHIGDVCNGKRNKASGYHWQWLEKEGL